MGITARIISDDEIKERTLYSLVNEGMKILEENIAEKPEDIDVIYVYGYGFPKYRGGNVFFSAIIIIFNLISFIRSYVVGRKRNRLGQGVDIYQRISFQIP